LASECGGAGPRPDLVGIEPRDEEAIEERVRRRRFKRRLKATASLLLAAAAGTFLACVKRGEDRPAQAPNPTTPEVADRPAPPRDAGASVTAQGHDAGAGDKSLVPLRRPPKHGPKVDREEHRKGMPVPDNLLE
jgi:hypothetical protein